MGCSALGTGALRPRGPRRLASGTAMRQVRDAGCHHRGCARLEHLRGRLPSRRRSPRRPPWPSGG
eukprot:9604018-Alexandrium_andersonii.AAC.1